MSSIRYQLRAAPSPAHALAFALAFALAPCAALAQGGPPYFTNDPGTPGNANWEINLASAETQQRGTAAYQTPQIDINFGVGDRIQLTYEVPYVLQTSAGSPLHSGWGNAYPGVKWRFFDQGDGGWQLSTFPQLETGPTARTRQEGIAGEGPRLLLPLEVARGLGPIEVNVEAGYYVPWHGGEERILGLVVGRSLSPRLELDAELYDDRGMGGPPHSTTLEGGGRYKLHRGLLLLFMAGPGIGDMGPGRPSFVDYLGVQILLSDYGRRLSTDP